MAWQTPKTDWKAGDIPAASDFNRIEGDTQYLKDEVDSHKAAAAPHSGHETPAGAQAKAEAAAGVVQAELAAHKAENASTSQKGHVQLSTSTTSTSTTLAATASAVNEVREMIPNINEAYIANRRLFTDNGTFTVPPGITTVYITGCGGGGGGRRNDPTVSSGDGGSGGGGAGAVIRIPISVSPGQNISVTVGKGGDAGTTDSRNGKAGGVTSFGSLLSIGGGSGGTSSSGGSGGSSPLTYTIFDGTDGGEGSRRTITPTPPPPLPSSFPIVGFGGGSLYSPFFGGGGNGDGYLPGQQGAYDYHPPRPGQDGFLLIEW